METDSRTRKGRFKLTAAEVILFLIMILCLLLLLTDNTRIFFRMLYSPFAFVLILVIVVEYIILKASDRSRIYLMQIENLTQKRQEDIAFIRSLEQRLTVLTEAARQEHSRDEKKSVASELVSLVEELKTRI